MNIVILGAGAIGSLFGALLSKENNVVLIGRQSHVKAIKKYGLKIKDITDMKVNISAENSVDNINFTPELIIITVKSYDTESAISNAIRIINKETIVLSLQNGLNNIEKIAKFIETKRIIAGVTTYGALFSKSGVIKHTGIGETILGELNRRKTIRIIKIINIFKKANIATKFSNNIIKEIWIKAIINSSINPLTTIFRCKNGYILENFILKNILEIICNESTTIANTEGLNLLHKNIFKKTNEVIRNTSENYSSMLQSVKQGKQTEIDSINGKIIEIGRKNNTDTSINEILYHIVKSEYS